MLVRREARASAPLRFPPPVAVSPATHDNQWRGYALESFSSQMLFTVSLLDMPLSLKKYVSKRDDGRWWCKCSGATAFYVLLVAFLLGVMFAPTKMPLEAANQMPSIFPLQDEWYEKELLEGVTGGSHTIPNQRWGFRWKIIVFITTHI